MRIHVHTDPRNRELWRLAKGGRQICANLRVLDNPYAPAWDHALIGYELRIDYADGEFIRSDLCKDDDALDTLSRQRREALIEKGWTDAG